MSVLERYNKEKAQQEEEDRQRDVANARKALVERQKTLETRTPLWKERLILLKQAQDRLEAIGIYEMLMEVKEHFRFPHPDKVWVSRGRTYDETNGFTELDEDFILANDPTHRGSSGVGSFHAAAVGFGWTIMEPSTFEGYDGPDASNGESVSLKFTNEINSDKLIIMGWSYKTGRKEPYLELDINDPKVKDEVEGAIITMLDIYYVKPKQ